MLEDSILPNVSEAWARQRVETSPHLKHTDISPEEMLELEIQEKLKDQA